MKHNGNKNEPDTNENEEIARDNQEFANNIETWFGLQMELSRDNKWRILSENQEEAEEHSAKNNAPS